MQGDFNEMRHCVPVAGRVAIRYSRTLPLAPQPKHWKMPLSKFAENDGEFFFPL